MSNGTRARIALPSLRWRAIASPATVVIMQPHNPSNPHSDGEQANTPGRHRNDNATWKDHDQPDIPHEDKAPRDPDKDYPDARDTVPR